MRTLVLVVLLVAMAGACKKKDEGGAGGGGGDLAAQAEEKADGACACKDFECTKEFIAWFNRTTLSEEAKLDALPGERRVIFVEAQDRATDCQDKLRPGMTP